MKIAFTVAILTLTAASAFAINPSNPTGAFVCAAPGEVSSKLAYCAANITSATTATQLGSIGIDARKQINVAYRSSVATSPTINFLLGGINVYSLTVSASTVPQITGFTVPFFDSITVSQSQPALISSTNAISMTVIENSAY